jgi:hypothetical protein
MCELSVTADKDHVLGSSRSQAVLSGRVLDRRVCRYATYRMYRLEGCVTLLSVKVGSGPFSTRSGSDLRWATMNPIKEKIPVPANFFKLKSQYIFE